MSAFCKLRLIMKWHERMLYFRNFPTGELVKAPKGFGKRYFTLTAIQAYSTTQTQSQRHSALYRHMTVSTPEQDAPLEDEESPEIAEELQKHPCHCNCHYGHRTRTRLRLYPLQFQDVPPYFFANSTISPPRKAD